MTGPVEIKCPPDAARRRPRKITEKDVTFELAHRPEEISVEGNAMASGDDDADRQAEQSIIRQLNDGNEWAWCSVTVRATYGPFCGIDHLGCCSYLSEEDFRTNSGYFEDMKATAIENLQAEVDRAHEFISGPNTIRLLVCVDVNAPDVELAYRKLHRHMMTATESSDLVSWETAEEWYPHGADFPGDPVILQAAIETVLEEEVESDGS